MVGGRFGWVRGLKGFGWGLVVVSLAAACGGRTSMLDSDAFLEPGETNPEGGTGGTGNTPQGGTATAGTINVPVPVAGTTNVPLPTAGSGGTGTTTPTPIQTGCQNYCNGYATKCAEKFQNVQECINTCQNELGATDPTCQKKGIAALRCLTPFFGNKKLSCDMAIGNGLAKCNNQVKAFKVCSGEIDDPTPTPDPPDPGTPICGGFGDVGPNYCKSSYMCADGSYTVSCFLSNMSGNYDCTCYMPNGTSLPVSLGGFMTPPCNYAATLCGVELGNQ
ncbi:MAG TPA: hypothetical protein VHB79_12380 [Polyangiaceae bacterium]|nr:hypothetical protein [Polyangiaceae bacterium]